MQTLLRYDMTTEPFPLQASPSSGNPNVATLTIVATNPNPSTPVTLQGLIITMPVEADAADLTADATATGVVAPTGWTLHDTQAPPGYIKYIFYPSAGQGTVTDEGLSFVFNNIQVNSQPGTVEVQVVEGSNDCQPPDCPTQALFITKFPSGWGTVSFWVDPTDIPQGGTTTLHWAGPEGATYSIEYFDWQKQEVVGIPQAGQAALSNEGQYPPAGAASLALAQTTVFTLNVQDSVGDQPYQAQVQKTVTVATPQQLSIPKFECSAEGVAVGEVITLSWQVQVADHCTLEVDGASGSVVVDAVDGALNSCQAICENGTTLAISKADGSGTLLGNITLPTPTPESITFRLSASKGAEVVQQTFTVDLLPPQIINFEGSRDSPGLKLHFKWQTAGAFSAVITSVGEVAASGEKDFILDKYEYSVAIHFTLICLGFGSQSQTIEMPIY